MTNVLHQQRTEHERYIVVNGRRWRAADPAIPDGLRSELVSELMAARRAVAEGKRAGDPRAIAQARRRVSDAKHALGERGRPWWETPSPHELRTRARATFRALSRQREHNGSGRRAVSTLEVARVVAPGWAEEAVAHIGALSADHDPPL